MDNKPQVKGATGIDEGFCLSYYHLSYRRKLIRTVWVMVLSPGMLLLELPHRGTLLLVTLAIGAVQAIYNYWKWQTIEKPSARE